MNISSQVFFFVLWIQKTNIKNHYDLLSTFLKHVILRLLNNQKQHKQVN